METQKEFKKNIKIPYLLKIMPIKIYTTFVFTILICVVVIRLNKIYELSLEVWFNFFPSLISTFLGVIGGFQLSRIQDKKKEEEKALNIKRNMLEIMRTEIESNKTIFSEDYAKEKSKEGNLKLEGKRDFQTKEWEQFKFRIFTEGITILNQTGYRELNELYKRFDRINLQKSLNKSINELSKREMLNHINDHIYNINDLLRAEDY
jgi:hypothetical protein